MTALPILIPATTLAFAVLAAVVSLRRAALATATALVGAVAALVLAGGGLAAALRVGALRHQLGGWPPPVGIEYVLDPLSGYMAVIIGIIGVLVLIYPARAGFGIAPGRRVPLASLTLLLLTGLLGVVFSGDLFNLFVFLEVYAIASYALIALGGDRALFASFRDLIIGPPGSGFYLLGVGVRVV
jgi:multicomponent Na+:H+ antiporter subunit D